MRYNNINELEIISKIQIVEALFKAVSPKIENEKIRRKMDEISSINYMFLRGRSPNSNNTNESVTNGNDELNTGYNTGEIEDLNQRELLWLCLQKEEELVKLYQKAISYFQLTKPEDKLFKNQLHQSLTHLNQMKMAEEALHYQN
jgi:hypothetical protein